MGYAYKGARHRPHKRKRRARANWEHKQLVFLIFIAPNLFLDSPLSAYFAYKRKKAKLQKIEQGFVSGGVYNNSTEGEYIIPKTKPYKQ